MAETQTATTQQIAKLLNRDERTIQRLASKGVLLKAGRDSFELIPTIRAFVDYLDDQLSQVDLTDDAFRAERTGLVKAQRERQELEDAVFKNELHRADDVEAIMNDVLTGIKMRFLAIPSRLSRVLLGQTQIAKVNDILTQAVHDALGDVMTYSAARFAERNPDYLRAQGLEPRDLLGPEPEPPKPDASEDGGPNG